MSPITEIRRIYTIEFMREAIKKWIEFDYRINFLALL